MNRTDYECVLRLSVHRVSELARTELGLAHVSPLIDRDLVLCLQHLRLDDILHHAARESSKRIVWVAFSPKPGCSLPQFNDATIRLKKTVGASWWE